MVAFDEQVFHSGEVQFIYFLLMYPFYIMFKESLPTSKSLVIIIFSNVSFSFSLQAWSFYLSCLGIRSVSNSFLYFVWSESQGLWAAAAKSLQLCLTLWNPIDSSPPGSAIPRILQARTLEWVAISFSSAWKWKVKVKSLSHVRLFETPWTVAYQAPPSMGFSRQEY